MKITGILILGIFVVLCFGLLWAYNSPGKNVPEPQDQNQVLVNALSTANHQIDFGTATRLIGNQKGNLKTNFNAMVNNNARGTKGARGGTFARSAFDQILAQPGVIGIRYYYALNDDGSPTLILAGVNTQGQLMTATVMDLSLPCPPYCIGTE
jgi:hypothetical protein